MAIRVLYVIETLKVGGSERSLLEISSAFEPKTAASGPRGEHDPQSASRPHHPLPESSNGLSPGAKWA